MSFPVPPSDRTARAPAEPSLPDAAPYGPYGPGARAPQTTDTPTPRWSFWTLASALCGIVTAVGIGAAIFSVAAAEVLCVAAGPALICGLVGLVNISESKGRLKGRGFALIGVVTGFVGMFVLTRMMTSRLSSHWEQYPPFEFPSDD